MREAHGYPEAVEAAQFLARRWSRRPGVGLILGSGLEGVVRDLCETRRISYRSIPHFPHATVTGHRGALHLGFWGNVPVAILEGRVHLYEGYSPAEIVFPTRVLTLAGIKFLVVTCAAGGIAPRAAPGSLMIFSDHLNLQGANALAGFHDPRWGPRFVDLSDVYDRKLRADARRGALALGLKCFEGVYASVLGPSYETPAESRALKRLGADAVGMSTVPEVIAARQRGVRVLAVATITNRAAGLGKQPLSHKDVLRVGKQASEGLARLLGRLVSSLGKGKQ
jgi:purine-nucleoside phosphorylase